MTNTSNLTAGTVTGEDRPDRPIADYTPEEVAAESHRLARVYLRRRGYTVSDALWGAPADSRRYIVATDTEGEAVLVEVRGRVDLSGSADALPSLVVDRARGLTYHRDALMWLLDDGDDVHSVRVDVIAITIVGERCARLRHLIGAYEWRDI